MNSWKLITPMLVSAMKSGDIVADPHVALLFELLLGLAEDVLRPRIFELERFARCLVSVRQQRLVLVVEQLHRALFDSSGEDERPVWPTDQRQIETEGVIPEEILLRDRADALQQLVAVGKPAEALDHRNVPVENLVKGVQGIVRRQVGHRPVPFLHAQQLIVQRLGVGEHQAKENPFDRSQASAAAGPESPLHQREAVRVAGVHLRRVAVHVAGKLVEHNHQRHQQARVLNIQGPVIVVPPGCERDLGAKLGPDLLVGSLRLAEPQVETIFDFRPNHISQDQLGLVHFGRGDLDPLALKQSSQVSPQVLRVRC